MRSDFSLCLNDGISLVKHGLGYVPDRVCDLAPFVCGLEERAGAWRSVLGNKTRWRPEAVTVFASVPVLVDWNGV